MRNASEGRSSIVQRVNYYACEGRQGGSLRLIEIADAEQLAEARRGLPMPLNVLVRHVPAAEPLAEKLALKSRSSTI